MELSADGDTLYFSGQPLDPLKVSEILGEFVSNSRREAIDNVLLHRSLNIATVVEGSVNTGNVSAVMRTSEAFGFLPFHVIKTTEQFKNSSRSSQGSDKWLDIRYWEDSLECIDQLKQRGYRIAATVPNREAVPVHELDFSVRTAFVFGNEAEGISADILACADDVCRIPMTGFVESFNISVAAALCLYQAFQARGGSVSGDLTPQQMILWRAIYYYRSVRRASDHLARLLT